jgi:hypothetical protein
MSDISKGLANTIISCRFIVSKIYNFLYQSNCIASPEFFEELRFFLVVKNKLKILLNKLKSKLKTSFLRILVIVLLRLENLFEGLK